MFPPPRVGAPIRGGRRVDAGRSLPAAGPARVGRHVGGLACPRRGAGAGRGGEAALPDLAADPQLLHRIRAEARAAARLRHPNIVEVYDYGEAADGDGPPVPYVVMEVVEGRSLAQLLSGGPLPWRVAVLICAQVAAALAAAHRRGIVHRDVKPANVMVAGTGVKTRRLRHLGHLGGPGRAVRRAAGHTGVPGPRAA